MKKLVKTKQETHKCNLAQSEIKQELRTFTIKGKSIAVDVLRRYCSVCKEVMYDEELDQQASQEVFKLYNERYGIDPKLIKKVRNEYGISQETLSKVLGCTKKTVNLYETGQSIPNEIYRTVLQTLIDEPSELVRYAKINDAKLTIREKEKIYGYDDGEADVRLQKYFLVDSPSEYNGYTSINIHKLIHTIVFFAQETINKTVLAKLLFYTEFGAYQKFAAPIIGLPFLKKQFGPMPKYFPKIIDDLDETGVIDFDIKVVNEYEFHKITSKIEFDNSLFLPDEIEHMNSVKQTLAGKTTAEVVEISHREPGWLETEDQKNIDYVHAVNLHLNID